MTTATSRPPRRIFYGWYVVAAVFVIMTTTSGLAFYNLSILLAAFVAEQGFPVGLASSATATFFIAGGIGGVIAGRLVDRIDAAHRHRRERQHRRPDAGVRRPAARAVAALCLPRRVRALPRRRRPRALDDGGGALVQRAPGARLLDRLDGPLASAASWWRRSWRWPIERLGLAGAAPWLGLALFLGIVPVTLLVLRPSPGAMGLEPDGVAPADARRQRAAARRRLRRGAPQPLLLRRLDRLPVPARRPGRGDRAFLPAGQHARRRGDGGAGALRAGGLEHRSAASPAAGSCSRCRRCASRWS